MTGIRWRGVVLAVTTSAAAVYALGLRPRLLTWGATREEVAAGYPGDELIPHPDDGSTMATTLELPPESVWPWLAQMGSDRGGWYSRDWLDNNGRPSADRIVTEWQGLSAGQRLSRVAAPGREPGSFTVVSLEPNRTLVLRASYGLFTDRDFDPHSGPAPTPWVDAIWGFHLRPTPSGGTRLVALMKPGWPAHDHPPVRPSAMQTRQFRNLKRRVIAHE